MLTIPLRFINNTPVDGTSYFAGWAGNNMGVASDTWAEGHWEFPESGTIQAVSFTAKVEGANLASGESVTIAVRVNDTTNIASSSEARFDVRFETWTVTGLSTAVVAGDKIALTVTNPTYVTNPDLVGLSALVFVGDGSVVTPVANFTASPVSGNAPLSVSFTDTSTNTPTSWLWDFGDGSTSTAQNPSHTYSQAGTYTVSLTATNAAGSDVETKTDYITVRDTHDGGDVRKKKPWHQRTYVDDEVDEQEQHKARRESGVRLRKQIIDAFEPPALSETITVAKGDDDEDDVEVILLGMP